MTDPALASALITTSARLTRLVRRRTPESTTAAWRALAIFEEHEALRVTEFAALDRLSQPSATAMVNRLVADGLLQRTPDPRDGRAHLLSLTDAGRDRLAALRHHGREAALPLLANLTPEESALLTDATALLTRLLDADRLDTDRGERTIR